MVMLNVIRNTGVRINFSAVSPFIVIERTEFQPDGAFLHGIEDDNMTKWNLVEIIALLLVTIALFVALFTITVNAQEAINLESGSPVQTGTNVFYATLPQ